MVDKTARLLWRGQRIQQYLSQLPLTDYRAIDPFLQVLASEGVAWEDLAQRLGIAASPPPLYPGNSPHQLTSPPKP